jgi:hypothetical protein
MKNIQNPYIGFAWRCNFNFVTQETTNGSRVVGKYVRFDKLMGFLFGLHWGIFLVEKGPAADATDAPQPWGLLCNPVMKMTIIIIIIIICPFPSNGTTVEWNWQGKTEDLGEKPVPMPLCPHKSHMDWPGIEPGHPRREAGG